MTHHYKVRRHDGVVDAVLLAALESDLVACREVAKHFQCHLAAGGDYTGRRDRARGRYSHCADVPSSGAVMLRRK